MSNKVCEYSNCQKKNTKHCELCVRNEKYKDLYDNGKNIECSSTICEHNKTNGKCSIKEGKGKVKNCKVKLCHFKKSCIMNNHEVNLINGY